MNISELGKKLSPRTIGALATIIIGVAVAVIGASRDFVYAKVHIEMSEINGIIIVLLGVGIATFGIWWLRGGENGAVKPDGAGDVIDVDLTGMPTRKADKIEVSYSKSTIDSLLEKVYRDGLVVQEKSYGREWILIQGDGWARRDLGRSWANTMFGTEIDKRSLADAGIASGAKLSVKTPKKSLMIYVGRYFSGGNPDPAELGYNDVKTVAELLNWICVRLVPTQKPSEYGEKWILMNADSATYFSSFNSTDQRSLQEAGLYANTYLEIVRPPIPSSAKELPVELPKELTLKMVERAQHLGRSSLRDIMDFFEEQASGNRNRITENDLEERFRGQFGTSDLFYRLQVLYLLGMIHRIEVGTENTTGKKIYTYEMSPEYRRDVYDKIPQLDSPSVTRRRVRSPPMDKADRI